MHRNTVKAIAWGNVVLVAVLGAAWPIQAQDTKAHESKSLYLSMAPIEQYRMDRDAEIALARTAAPASISRDADVLVLGQKHYETAVHGKNGFVCMVGRSWTGPLTNPEFWNPKNRSPMCYNPPAARSVVPFLLKEAEMALAGFSKTQVTDAIKTAVDKKELGAPESGSMCYMMSKEAYLADQGGHNLSHLMFELPHTDGAAWGADLVGSPGLFQDSPIFFVSFDPAPMTEFNVPMGLWSDGTAVTASVPH
jgi:hypothetical protein